MTHVAARLPGAPVRVVFDGQSLNNVPAAPQNYPSVLMSGRRVPWANLAVNGDSWDTLAGSTGTRHFFEQATTHAGATVLVMNGGTEDILDDDSAATIYADAASYADDAKAGGYDYVIVSTIPALTGLSGGQETVRVDANTLLLADAGGHFDAVVDLAATFDDPTDTTLYQFDQVHPTVNGAVVMAGLFAPYLDAAITALT